MPGLIPRLPQPRHEAAGSLRAEGPAQAGFLCAESQPPRAHLLRGGHLAGADGPNRLVGNHHLGPVGDLVGQGLGARMRGST
jgi:hypothetical protein